MATSVVTPVAGLVASPPATFTRPWAISSLACSRERARPRRTSSASRRRRRGGTSGGLGRLCRFTRVVERAPQLGVRGLEDADVLLERTLLERLDGNDHVVDRANAGAHALGLRRRLGSLVGVVEIGVLGHALRLLRRGDVDRAQ